MVRQRDETGTDGATGSSRDDPQVVNRYAGTGVTGTVIALGVLAIALVVVLAQNTEAVPFQFVTFDAEIPLYVLLLISAVGASLMTVLVSAVWRRRRRRMRNEREELGRLRQRSR